MTLMTLGSQKWNGTTLHFTKEPFLFTYICQKHHQPSCSVALWLNAWVSTPVLDLNSTSFSVTFWQEKIKAGQIVLPFLPIPWSKRKNTDEDNWCIYFSCQLVSYCINGRLMKKIHCPHLPVNQYAGIISGPKPLQSHTWC